MKAGTFTQIYIHIVFGVKFRKKHIAPEWECDLHAFITGIVKRKGQKLLAINGTSDHIHLLVALYPVCAVSDLVREIKKSSNTWINENQQLPYRFLWQNGFGAFSHSPGAIENVKQYIKNQKEHHQSTSFKDEYIVLLNEFEIDFKEEYLFDS